MNQGSIFVGIASVMMMSVVACSSGSTGTGVGDGGTTGTGGGGLGGLVGGGNGGGTSGNGGTSGTAAGTSGGGTSGSAKPPASSTSGGGGACGVSTGNAGCDTCLMTSCCSQAMACDANPDCKPLYNCIEECGGVQGTCSNNCLAQYPNGREVLNTTLQCINGSCGTACQ